MTVAPGHDPEDAAKFPLDLAIAAIVATGLGLIASAANIHWGAGTPPGDALDMAWIYVNVALAWTWLAVWPAVALGRERVDRNTLAWDVAVILMGAIPAMAVAAFLSGVPVRVACETAALQVAIGLLAMGAMAWRAWAGAGAIAGTLATIGIVLPVLGYIWAEFFPVAWQGWRAFIPVVAVARAATAGLGSVAWWAAGTYTLLGFALWGIAPRKPI